MQDNRSPGDDLRGPLTRFERASLWLCILAAAAVWLTVAIIATAPEGPSGFTIMMPLLGAASTAIVTGFLALLLTLQSLATSRRTILWAVPLGIVTGVGWYFLSG